jgi:methionyl-tRNA formyltransferase
MRAVVFAYHNMGIAGLEALKRNGIGISAVFTHRDDPGENVWFGSVADWAEKKGIPVFCPETVNSAEWVDQIRRMAPDVLFSFYYRKLLKGDILQIPAAGAYNLHGSLLPAYRGRCPVNWVLVRGEKRTGVTLHHMIEQADAGDIVGQREILIGFEDTAATLYAKLCSGAGELLDELLPLIQKGTAPRISQDPERASYFGGREPTDGKIDWFWPVERIYNLVRAVTEPYPGAFTGLGDKKVLIWRALPERIAGPGSVPGTVVLTGEDVHVRAVDGRLRLLEIEVDGLRLSGSSIFEYFREKKGIILQ